MDCHEIASRCSNSNVGATSELQSGRPCILMGRIHCPSCKLYCNKLCMELDHGSHADTCESIYATATWKPEYVASEPGRPFDHSEPCMPAFDVLNLTKNETQYEPLYGYTQDLNLLFAAGDLSSVIQTLVTPPRLYENAWNIFINHCDFDIVVRHTIILLIALSCPPERASLIMIHFWYSASIPNLFDFTVRHKILPFIERACMRTKNEIASHLHLEKWESGNRSVSILLTSAHWKTMLSFFEVPNGFNREDAIIQRELVVQNPALQGIVEQRVYSQPPAWRQCFVKFLNDGILHPFGASTTIFDVPNPTLYQTHGAWRSNAYTNPLDDWRLQDALEECMAPNDVYGGLYFYIHKRLFKFCSRISNLLIHFRIYHFSSIELAQRLRQENWNQHFDRIQTSNMLDYGQLDRETCLAEFAPLLKTREVNPHATIISLFSNNEAIIRDQLGAFFANNLANFDKQFISPVDKLVSETDDTAPDFCKVSKMKGFMRDNTRQWKLDKILLQLERLGNDAGMVMKETNTIANEWPMRLVENSKNFERDLKCLMTGSHSGSERYVEWVFKK